MKQIKFNDTRHCQFYIVPDFEEFHYLDRIANTVVWLYMELRKYVAGDSLEDEEDRAITMANLIVKYLKQSLRYKPIGVYTGKKKTFHQKDGKFILLLETNTHVNFKTLHEIENIFHCHPQYRGGELTEPLIFGQCGEEVGGEKLWINIKTTNPENKSLGAWEIFDTTIHEYTHFMRRVSKRCPELKDDIPFFREWLNIILKEIFIFIREG